MRLTLVRGIPGSGKTTYVKKLGCFHVEADFFFISNGKYSFDKKLLNTHHVLCQRMTQLCLEQEADCVVSNTFTKLWEMQPYIKIGRKLGAEISIFRMSNSYISQHSVPEHIILQMTRRFEDCEGEVWITK